jgi:hypothetical protein
MDEVLRMTIIAGLAIICVALVINLIILGII